MQRSESVQRQAILAPFRHPHFETAQARDARLFREEIADYVVAANAMRAKLATVRVLEVRA